jgi:hypothetical protein
MSRGGKILIGLIPDTLGRSFLSDPFISLIELCAGPGHEVIDDVSAGTGVSAPGEIDKGARCSADEAYDREILHSHLPNASYRIQTLVVVGGDRVQRGGKRSNVGGCDEWKQL